MNIFWKIPGILKRLCFFAELLVQQNQFIFEIEIKSDDRILGFLTTHRFFCSAKQIFKSNDSLIKVSVSFHYHPAVVSSSHQAFFQPHLFEMRRVRKTFEVESEAQNRSELKYEFFQDSY